MSTFWYSDFAYMGGIMVGQLMSAFFVYLVATSFVFGQALGAFPTKPDLVLTPGALCTEPSEIRYPEQIKYCERNVGTREKWAVISRYTGKFKFTLNSANRLQFKIDHYIPLCMGGANVLANLWPQHETVFKKTDPLEERLCEKLAEGKITQKLAIEKIMQAKLNLEQIPTISAEMFLLK